MMKFALNSAKGGGCRLGVLHELGRFDFDNIETPMCMLYTRGGNAPHLTKDVLKKIHRVPQIAHLYLGSLCEHTEAISEFKDGVANFCGMKDHAFYCSLQDPATEVPPGFNEKTGTAIWAKGGKMKVDVDSFIRMQEALKPDICQALHDGDTNKTSGQKRLGKAVDRTIRFLDEIQDKWKNSERLQETALFGVIEGGYSIQERTRSVKETIARNVDGYVIAGFHNYGPKSELFDLEDTKEILETVSGLLPDDKPRLMHGVWRPDKVMEGIQLGIDMFDSSYPYIVTERGSALVFSFNEVEDQEQDGNSCTSQGFSISLKEKKYFEDFGPIMEGCTCYTCTHFTRSYINHLLTTSEMLSQVLLMIHNFHHYFEFFHQVRVSLHNGSFEQMKDLIQRQKPDDG